ncbi:MAG: T9SS type A sorting domain-containing protein [Bacteroidota bacterium]
MKKGLLSLITVFLSAMAFAQNCSKPFISEYVEGWSNNKAIEIYNPTNAAIDLSEYFLQRYSNGSTTASAQGSIEAKTVQLTGTLAPYSALVFVVDQRDPLGTGQDAPIWDSLEVIADYFLCPVYEENNVMYFNGDDAMLLAKGLATNPNAPTTVVCDVFGKIGQLPGNFTNQGAWTTVAPYTMTVTPGWTLTGASGTMFDPNNAANVAVTADHGMIRKSTIQVGDLTPVNDFNPLAEWDTIPAVIPRTDTQGNIVYQVDGVTPQWLGNWESLGYHNCNCAPAAIEEITLSDVTVFPNPTNGSFFLKNVENVVAVKIVNALGQEVKSVRNNASSVLSIDLDGKSGVYFVKLTAKDGQTTTRKVIVK